MAFRTIGQDASVLLAIGPVVNGDVISFGASVQFLGIAKSIEIDEEALDSDVSALGDDLERNRFRRRRATVRFNLQVPSTGPNFAGSTGYSMRADIKALSSLATPQSFVGGVSKRSMSIQDGENIEVVEMKVGIEGWTYTGLYA